MSLRAFGSHIHFNVSIRQMIWSSLRVGRLWVLVSTTFCVVIKSSSTHSSTIHNVLVPQVWSHLFCHVQLLLPTLFFFFNLVFASWNSFATPPQQIKRQQCYIHADSSFPLSCLDDFGNVTQTNSTWSAPDELAVCNPTSRWRSFSLLSFVLNMVINQRSFNHLFKVEQ